jgi:hypothetical protein
MHLSSSALLTLCLETEELSGQPPKSEGEGLTETERKEVLPDLAFSAGYPTIQRRETWNTNG